MSIKIENVVMEKRNRGLVELREFVLAMKELKVGQSFEVTLGTVNSNYRNAVSIVQIIMDVQLTTRTHGDKMRVGRVG